MPANLIGAFLSILALVFGLVTGMIVKLIPDTVPIFTILLGRFWFSLPILVALTFWMRGRAWLAINDRVGMSLRVAFGFAGIFFWFLSVRHIPIGLATSLFQSSVIFITILSPFLLGERVGLYRWSAVILGLAGVILITDPFNAGLPAGAIYGVLAAVSGASLSIVLRRLGKSEHPLSVASIYNISGGVAVGALVLLIPSQLVMPSSFDIWLIVLLGVVGSFLQICLTTAYRFTDASIIAILRYLQVPGAILLGYLLFSEVPTLIQLGGTCIVVGSSVFIILRELYLGRRPIDDN